MKKCLRTVASSWIVLLILNHDARNHEYKIYVLIQFSYKKFLYSELLYEKPCISYECTGFLLNNILQLTYVTYVALLILGKTSALLLGKNRYPLYRRLGGTPGPVWTVKENITPTGIRSRDHPARSQLLYLLS
jgi:hypothetical protein